jgi:regulatory protein
LTQDEKASPSLNEMRAFAYRLLGRREYSVFELGRRIRQKWPGANGVEDLVEALAEENLVSDERYAESFVRFRLQRYQGPLKIRAALRAKGISDALISRELDSHTHEWTPLARQWLDRQHAGPIDFELKKKFYRRLVNRGFTHDQAMDALNQPTQERIYPR